VTECMEPGCTETATHVKRTEGFFYDRYKCEEHASESGAWRRVEEDPGETE